MSAVNERFVTDTGSGFLISPPSYSSLEPELELSKTASSSPLGQSSTGDLANVASPSSIPHAETPEQTPRQGVHRIPRPPQEASFEYRLSAHDLSLHTLPLQHGGLRSLENDAQVERRMRSSWVTEDDSAFWTARGTLRGSHLRIGDEILIPVGDSAMDREPVDTSHERDNVEEEEEREVIVVWRREAFQTPIKRPPTTTSSPTSDLSDESPPPPRILYIFHPPPDPAAQQSVGAPLDPWRFLTVAQDQLEKSFWRLIMPSISGLVGMGESLAEVFGGVPEDLPGRVYAQETIYTLRLPPETSAAKNEGLENTVRPVLLKKRAGIPAWEAREREHWRLM
ncbi:hypothetical protein P7C73_g4997, partial [Tremellales sp. Uapishka_1]